MKLFRKARGSVQTIGVLGLTSLALILAGCASDKKEYISDASQSSRQGKSLEVPPDLIAPGRDDRLQMPATDPKAAATASTYNNAGKPVVQSDVVISPDQLGKARIARAGSQRWLVIPGTPQVVWPQIRRFWEDMGFTIQTDLPQFYVMETDWAESRTKNGLTALGNYQILRAFISNAERDKFRTRLETSTEPGKVEIYVSHRALEERDLQDTRSQVGWQTKPSDPGKEIEMLRRMMVAFGGSTEEQANAAIAAPATPDKAHLITAADGTFILSVDDVQDRTWRQTGLALDRVGMVVEDRDRAKSIYFVRYVTDEDLGNNKPSAFAWMAFWRSKDKTADTDRFRIVVAAEGQKTVIRVQNKDGVQASPASTKQILGLLYNELK